MRLPQVSERVKEAPAQVLRGVFAGIGQLLLITDKLRNKAPADQQVPRTRPPEPSEMRADPAPPPAPVPADTPVPSPAPVLSPAPVPPVSSAGRASEPRDFDKTGNVRLLASEKAAAGDTAATVAEEPAVAVAEEPAVAAEATSAAAAEPGAPLPNYDTLSIASLRARLRNLDVPQLRQLVEYEQAHADRADVIAMFTRRIAKLQAETTPEERGEAEAEADIEAQEDVEADVQEEEAEAVEDES
jgi:hypothetical protein